MTSFTRADRVAGKLQRVLCELLTTKVKDPRLHLVTVTSVKLSPDLKLAKIYFTTAGGSAKTKDAYKGFETARGYIKRSLAQELGLRYMPDLRFYYDDSFDTSARVNKLLKSLKTNEQDHHTSEGL